MAGCCWGSPADLPWSVVFSNSDSLCPLREPLHPAQLYEALLALGVFGFLYWFRTRKRFDGQLILMYFCLAGLVRFVVEFFRSPLDYRGHVFFGWMPMTQLVALLLFLLCGSLLLFWSLRARPRG
jgi:phosphatidylglycerol:prolipoprotein diacylglycerol transferase